MLPSRAYQKINSKNSNTEQYSIVASLVSYENTALVQRNSFYVLANAALLAATWEPIHKLLTCTNSRQISDPLVYASERSAAEVTVFGLSIVGLLLSLLWLLAFKASMFWLHHWYKHLKELEYKTFGLRHLFRDFVPDKRYPNRIRATLVLELTVLLFIIVWSLPVFFVLYVWSGLPPTDFMWIILCGVLIVAGVTSITLFLQEFYRVVSKN